MNKLLRSIAPDLPQLRFKTQQSDGAIWPDMWGYADGEAHTSVENKFWASLTDNQPVTYLEELAAFAGRTVLLALNWRQKSTARSQLKLTIEDTLDSGLPRAYTPDLYNQKCSAVFEHVYECCPEQNAEVYA